MTEQNYHKHIGFMIHELDILLHRMTESEAKRMEFNYIRGPQSKILQFLFKNTEYKIYQRDIEKLLLIRKASVTQLLNGMETNGYITRRVSDKDRRFKQILLTQKSIKLKEKIDLMIIDIEKKLVNNISEDEKEIFFEVIGKVKENIQKNS